MMRTSYISLRVGVMLAILFIARAGQTLHIYMEDPLHFEAFCRELVPANGASCGVKDHCIVDDFYFFPFLECVGGDALPGNSFLVAVLSPAPTRCKQGPDRAVASLRAPPVMS